MHRVGPSCVNTFSNVKTITKRFYIVFSRLIWMAQLIDTPFKFSMELYALFAWPDQHTLLNIVFSFRFDARTEWKMLCVRAREKTHTNSVFLPLSILPDMKLHGKFRNLSLYFHAVSFHSFIVKQVKQFEYLKSFGPWESNWKSNFQFNFVDLLSFFVLLLFRFYNKNQ